MSGIFCLETEWEQTIHDMKTDSSARPLLQYLKAADGAESVFRRVATKAEFEYYLEYLSRLSYRIFNVVYLCFNGKEGEISFANGESISLLEIADSFPGIFSERKVHFSSCSTLKVESNILSGFKEKTKAKLVTGYTKSVPFHDSFIFELWLLHLLTNHKSLGSIKLQLKVDKEMEFFSDELKFLIF